MILWRKQWYSQFLPIHYLLKVLRFEEEPGPNVFSPSFTIVKEPDLIQQEWRITSLREGNLKSIIEAERRSNLFSIMKHGGERINTWSHEGFQDKVSQKWSDIQIKERQTSLLTIQKSFKEFHTQVFDPKSWTMCNTDQKVSESDREFVVPGEILMVIHISLSPHSFFVFTTIGWIT